MTTTILLQPYSTELSSIPLKISLDLKVVSEEALALLAGALNPQGTLHLSITDGVDMLDATAETTVADLKRNGWMLRYDDGNVGTTVGCFLCMFGINSGCHTLGKNQTKNKKKKTKKRATAAAAAAGPSTPPAEIFINCETEGETTDLTTGVIELPGIQLNIPAMKTYSEVLAEAHDNQGSSPAVDAVTDSVTPSDPTTEDRSGEAIQMKTLVSETSFVPVSCGETPSVLPEADDEHAWVTIHQGKPVGMSEVFQLLSSMRQSQSENFEGLRASLQENTESLRNLEKRVVTIDKAVSSGLEAAYRSIILSTVKNWFPEWKPLLPCTGKGGLLFRSNHSLKPAFATLFNSTIGSLSSSFPNYATKEAYPKHVECDLVVKYTTGELKSNLYTSPTSSIESLASSSHLDSKQLPVTHQPRSFNHLVVAEITRSPLATSLTEFENRQGIPSLLLVFKILQLERCMWALKHRYNGSDDLIAAGIIVSPAVQARARGENASLWIFFSAIPECARFLNRFTKETRCGCWG
ncbi:hypothetical protein BDR26DRAFT_868884, partial [Obelidium mucronatum]